MAKAQKPAHWTDFQFEHRGKIYEARWGIASGSVIVQVAKEDGWHEKSTHVGGPSGASLARIMARELVE